MNQDEVRSTLGEPEVIHRGSEERWQYGAAIESLVLGLVFPTGTPANAHVIDFDEERKVASWRAPD